LEQLILSNNKISVLFAIPSISRVYTGVYELVKNIAKEFYKKDVRVEVHGMRDKYSDLDIESWLPIVPKVHEINRPVRLSYGRSLHESLLICNCNIGHIQVLWSYAAYAIYRWSRTKKAPYIITANGYLDEWALGQSRIKKRIALKLVFSRILRSASCIQVNSENEYIAVRKLGLKNPVCIISNGITIPELGEISTPPWSIVKSAEGKKILLFLGRIHEKKGPDLLLNAWRELHFSKKLNDWHLIIVGFSDVLTPFELSVKKFVVDNDMDSSVSTFGGKFGQEMNSCYSNCDAFILPSFSEGAAIAALAAWAFSKPLLITEQCNLSTGFDIEAAIRIKPTVDSIKIGLIALTKMSNNSLMRMGARGREHVMENYSWKSVSEKTLEVYEWVVDPTRPVPASMKLDEHFNGQEVKK
jgi:poly(glycerol-phosphate) alpha-glucosyltransferase